MTTRGKRLAVTADGDDCGPLEGVLFNVICTAARAFENDDYSPRARMSARKTLQEAADAWAICVRDRMNQKQRQGDDPGKLGVVAKQRIRDQYAERVRNGQKYGAIKHLSNTFGVDRKTVHSVVSEKKK